MSEAIPSEAIVLTREYDGTYTVGVGGSLILSDLSRVAAHGFVAAYRRLAGASVLAGRGGAEAGLSTGGRLGQALHRSPASPGRAVGADRRQG